MAAGTMRERLFPPVRAYQLALALALAIGYALAVTGYVATGRIMQPSKATVSAEAVTPSWSKPLNGVRPYQVQRNYGTSGGVTCDLAIYTTNKAALEGKARLHPGDTTATVCVVRKTPKAPPAP